MGTLVNATGSVATNPDPLNKNPGDATKVRYAVYLDDQGRCVGVEDLWLVSEREITQLMPVLGSPPSNANPPIYEIWVQAKVDNRYPASNEYKTCYSGGFCFRC
jgi:hypothetical protein